jgi:alpha-1,2-mannosyltransferase
VVTTFLVMAALFGCYRVIDSRIRATGRGQLSRLLAILAPLPLTFSSAAASNMTLGQVSFAVAALVLVDVTLLPRRWRGTLVGLAGAVKLTPMILVPYYLFTRQWRAAINASVAFGAATLLGTAFRWSDSIRYWLHPELVRTSFGDLARSDNWSVYGVLSRLGLGGTVRTLVWLVLAAALLALAFWRARRHHRAGQELEAVLVMGLAAGLVVVATWPHHLLFGLAAGTLLAVQRPLVGFPLMIAFMLAGFQYTFQVGDLVVVLIALLVVLGLPKPPRPAAAAVGRSPDGVAEPVPDPT